MRGKHHFKCLKDDLDGLALTVPTDKVPNKHVPLEKTVGFESVEEEILQGQHQPSFTA